ncbi:MAG: serine hydrolase [Pseudomonadota bacterium]
MKARSCIAGRFAVTAIALVLTQTGFTEQTDMQQWLNSQVSDGQSLAISAALLQGGKVSYMQAGKLSPDDDRTPDSHTQFQIGSITKSFTNLLLADMIARGDVAYDTTVGELLADEIRIANPAVAEITLLQLATHTSGLPRLPANLTPSNPLDPYAGYDEKALLAAVSNARDKQTLGDHYGYSNFGVGLLGYLLGRVHGDGYQAALAEYVLEPQGLARTAFVVKDNVSAGFRDGQVVPDWGLDVLDGAGSLWSSAEDMMRLAQIQLGIEKSPLKQERSAGLQQVASTGSGFAVTPVWHVADSTDGKVYWHNGGTGGFWSFFGFRPDTGDALLIMVSGDSDPTSVGLDWFGWQSMEATPPVVADDVSGQYELTPNVGIGVFQNNGVVFAQLTGQSPLPLDQVDESWYASNAVDASLRFVRDEGAVVAVELVQNGAIQRARKVGDTATIAEPRKSIDLPAEVLAGYVGEYAINDAAKFTIRLTEDGLQAKLTGQPFFPIFAQSEHVFFYKVVDAELHFEHDDNGVVTALVLHQGAIRQRAVKSP